MMLLASAAVLQSWQVELVELVEPIDSPTLVVVTGPPDRFAVTETDGTELARFDNISDAKDALDLGRCGRTARKVVRLEDGELMAYAPPPMRKIDVEWLERYVQSDDE